MDSPCSSRSFSSNLFYLFLLVSSNLLTLFISTTLYSPCSLETRVESVTPIGKTADCAPRDPKPTPKVEIVEQFNASESEADLPDEFLAFTSPQQLPLGYNSNFDSDKILPPVGHPCALFPDMLRQYMSYKVNGSCPDDELLAQKLLLRGSYTCKNYSCLINRMHTQKDFDDCKDCFDLAGREKTRWTGNGRGLDFSVDEVLAVKKPGTIRIGLDIGGGVATFAVRMRKRNITIITASMNLNGPFNSFIASRGVIPLYISISQRLPFFDNTLDIVHSMHVLSNWIPTKLLHFLIFDIYRVLRPGGLFWLDHFFCVEDELENVYTPLIESVGFNKAKWVVGRKLDRGPELNEMYLSALLEKPLENSW
ncbi:probable methyltransferase PMT19 [Olea europaea subsp. europaea]|uniref:Probable methyltransferase PMT19 n=1 Tax=Olea europaea subsp. europaea TaxID=158383 RepID=A0A8S0S8H8_OLEEU|nr:probable methyltransferase PMT19 [Olea europaea subsp. europaea]